MAKHSCEPNRTSPYSEDLRWRMVWQREVQGLTLEKVAKNLCVDTSTVFRVLKQFNNNGTVNKKSYVSSNGPMKLTKSVQLTVLNLVLDNPGIYLWEIQQMLLSMFALDVSPSALCIFLKKSNFSRKKMQLVAAQQDQDLRSTFVSDVSIYRRKFLIFIDETGCDRRNALRKYGYGLRGKPIRCQKLLVRGKRISVIAAMTTRGILDLKIVHGTVTGDIFEEFVSRQLLRHVMPFNGINPNSIVVLDNCSVHYASGIANTLEELGIIVQYLPPYSPDFNPIELLFSKVKYVLRQLELELSATDDIEMTVLTAFSAVTTRDCEEWIESCHIYA